MLQYFELVFFQLQLVKILCKLIIIWVNYKKNKKGSLFYETPCSTSTGTKPNAITANTIVIAVSEYSTRTEASPTSKAMTSDSMWYESPIRASELVM